jgi:hypothetical protein
MIIDFRGMEFAMRPVRRRAASRRMRREAQDSGVTQNMRNLFTALLS